MATLRCANESSARYTRADAPRPSSRRILYLPMDSRLIAFDYRGDRWPALRRNPQKEKPRSNAGCATFTLTTITNLRRGSRMKTPVVALLALLALKWKTPPQRGFLARAILTPALSQGRG